MWNSLLASVRPKLVCLLADPLLPLSKLQKSLAFTLGLAVLDAEDEALRASSRNPQLQLSVKKGKAPSSLLCPALLERIAQLQELGKS